MDKKDDFSRVENDDQDGLREKLETELVHAKEATRSDDNIPVEKLAVKHIESAGSKPPVPPTMSDARRKFNHYFLYTLVAGLVFSALISVVAVLVGEVTTAISKAFGTTFSMVVHTLAILVLFSATNKSRFSFLINVMVGIVALSFLTSIIAIWEIIKGDIIGDLFLLYIYTFCIAFWAQLLLMLGENASDKLTRIASYVALGFSGVFYLLLIPTVFINYPAKLPDIHLRLLAAVAILLATTSVLCAVFRRIHITKHPEAKSDKSMHAGLDIAIALIAIVIGAPLVLYTLAALTYQSSYNYTEERIENEKSEREFEQQLQEEKRRKQVEEANRPPIDCQMLPSMKDPPMLVDLQTYSFVKHTPTQKQVELATTASNTQPLVIYYDYADPLVVVDKECMALEPADLMQDDTVRLYRYERNQNALAILQKVNVDLADALQ